MYLFCFNIAPFFLSVMSSHWFARSSGSDILYHVKVTSRLTIGLSWCRAPFRPHNQILITVLSLWGALSDDRTSLSSVRAHITDHLSQSQSLFYPEDEESRFHRDVAVYQTAWRCIPEDRNLNIGRRETLKTHKCMVGVYNRVCRFCMKDLRKPIY
jgi:hypothetical protein